MQQTLRYVRKHPTQIALVFVIGLAAGFAVDIIWDLLFDDAVHLAADLRSAGRSAVVITVVMTLVLARKPAETAEAADRGAAGQRDRQAPSHR